MFNYDGLNYTNNSYLQFIPSRTKYRFGLTLI